MKAKLFLVLLIVLCAAGTATAQHYVGVRNAFGINGVDATPELDNAKTLKTPFNPGIVYRYEHNKYFAFQAEFNYISKGYGLDSVADNHIYSYELPILAQGFMRFGKFRPYVTAGPFIGYINKRDVTAFEGETAPYVYDDYDNRFEYGIIGGAGLGYTISRFELQAEWRYQYAFSFLRTPHINGVSQYLNATQMMISLTLFYRFGK